MREIFRRLRMYHITAMGRPYFDLVLPTTKHERVLGLSTLSYKLAFFSPIVRIVVT